MSGASARLSQSDLGPVPQSLVTRESLRRREIGRLVHVLSRVRAAGLTFAVVVIVGLGAWDDFNWPGWWVVGAAILFPPIAILDFMRLARGRDYLFSSVGIDLAFGVAIQSCVIVATGGGESPFLPIYGVLSLVSGIVLEGHRRFVLLFAVWCCIWTMVLGASLEWWPRLAPAFFGIEPLSARFLVTYGFVVTLFCTGLNQVGALVSRTVDRMLDDAIEARQSAVNALADRNRELVHLSGAIAHELKNPLASVQGLVQLLRRGGKNSEQRFEVLERELLRTREILDEFLNFSRPLGELTVQTVVLEQLLGELATLHEGIAADQSVTIARFEGPDVTVDGDPRKLGQALTNLLMNAIDAAPEGSSVRWLVSDAGDAVIVGVEDDGAGMSDDLLGRATQIGATTKPHGSGIGLAVARTIAEQHGGALRLENRPGGGFSAALVLPKTHRPAEGA